MIRKINYTVLMSKNKKLSQKKSAAAGGGSGTTPSSQFDSNTPLDCGPVTRDKSGNIAIRFLAKPGAKQNSITDISSEGVGIQISAPPVDGEANTELIKYLSKVFGIRKSDITLDRGSKSRNKTILIAENCRIYYEYIEKREC